MNHETLAARLTTLGLAHHLPTLSDIASPTLGMRLERAALHDIPLGVSRAAGPPDLPVGVPWPERSGHPLDFLLQVRLSELAGMPGAEQLPPRGRLWFWYDGIEGCWGHEADAGGAWRVDFEPDEDTPLERRPIPWARFEGYERYGDGDHEAVKSWHPCRVVWSARITFDPVRLAWLAGLAEPRITPSGLYVIDARPDADPVEGKALMALRDDHALSGGHPDDHGTTVGQHWLLGHGYGCQGTDLTETMPRPQLALGPWRVLLQLDYDPEGTGWMWCDAGRLFFLICAQDLERHDLSRIWGSLSSG
jgi:hypothetical protein